MPSSAAAPRLEAGSSLPPYSIAITIDDGYRDFYETARPVFGAYGLPVTVYAVTDFVDGKLWLWVDQVHYAFQHTTQPALRMELPQGEMLQLPLGSEGQRRLAARKTCEALKRLPNDVRLVALERLPEMLAVRIPQQPPPGDEPLSWEEVRKLPGQPRQYGFLQGAAS